MTRRLFSTALAVLLTLTMPAAALAVSVQGNVRNVPYVIGFHRLNSMSQPYLGQLSLNFNHGVISGTYTDISPKPGGPFANAHNLPVSGGVSGSHVTLVIRQVTFKGTLQGTKMSGNATIRGSIYEFAAHQGTPGSLVQ